MCLIALAWRAHPKYPLIVAANRDEFHARPTAPAAFWDDAPVLAGRDLLAGGSWMGITRTGRFAALTNVRDREPKPDAPSRGALVADFLRGDDSAAEYVRDIAARGAAYSGFNLLLGDHDALWFVSNHGARPCELPPGVHAVGNGPFGPGDAKARRAAERLRELLADERATEAGELFALLADRTPAADAELPDTGMGREVDRAVSAPLVVTPEYGTRSSTVLTLDDDGCVDFVERSFGRAGEPLATAEYHFAIAGDPA
ncbi:NRDE family protein [soil metagenome]